MSSTSKQTASSPGEQLVVRQYERYTCALKSRIAVEGESVGRVALATAESGAGAGVGVVAAEVIDCSAGGLGLRCSTYFPKQSELSVRVWVGAQAGETEEVTLSGRVQRASMTDSAPTYYLGVSFLGEGQEQDRRVGRLLNAAKRDSLERHEGASRKEAPRA